MLLGIDIGTSACKVALFDYEGKILAERSQSYPVYYPKPGWAQQNPDEWYKAVCDALLYISSKIDLKDVKAVGVGGQSWSCIPVDQNGRVLYNTPIWFDVRAKQECEMLKKAVGENKIFDLCKNPVEPSYTTPKALWFKRNLPDIYKNTRYFLQSNSFIVYKLTGKFSQDRSQGYGHFFYDMDKGCYNDDMAEIMGLDINKFPKIFDCSDIVGHITKNASTETGIPEGIPVAAGGLDAACATLGAGVIENGQTQEQGGQAGGMSICMDQPIADRKLIVGNHVVPGKWLLQGGTVAGGASMEWFSREFGRCFGEDEIFKKIDKTVSDVPCGSDGLIFLPYLNGERSPIWDTNAKGVYYGITFSTTKAHFARSVMEGVAYSLRHNLETAYNAGAECDTLYAVGGSCNSDIWMQIKADVTKKNIEIPDSYNAAALGVAILAGVGVGKYEDFDDAVRKTINIKKRFSPDDRNVKIYDEGYEKYLRIYENLKGVMSE